MQLTVPGMRRPSDQECPAGVNGAGSWEKLRTNCISESIGEYQRADGVEIDAAIIALEWTIVSGVERIRRSRSIVVASQTTGFACGDRCIRLLRMTDCQ